jgi:hypothetical protein
LGKQKPVILIFHKKFWNRFLGYLLVVTLIHLLLFIFLGGVGMADDISNEARRSYAAIPVFFINRVFGFPLSLFFPYDPINAQTLSLILILANVLNCLIQFYILSFIWKIFKRQ